MEMSAPSDRVAEGNTEVVEGVREFSQSSASVIVEEQVRGEEPEEHFERLLRIRRRKRREGRWRGGIRGIPREVGKVGER